MPAPRVSLSTTIPKKKHEIAYFLDYLEKSILNNKILIKEELRVDIDRLITIEEPTSLDCKKVLERIYDCDYEFFFRYHRGFKRIVAIGGYKSPRSSEEKFLLIKAEVPEKIAEDFKKKIKKNKTDVTKFINKVINDYLKT
jgi:hypothetical protein